MDAIKCGDWNVDRELLSALAQFARDWAKEQDEEGGKRDD